MGIRFIKNENGPIIGVDKKNIAILAGPGQPDSIAENKRLNKMVVSSYDYPLAKEISEIIKTENFKLFPWPDVQGCELCAAAKNVYSALGGMCEGAEQTTLKGQIMSVSMHEMQNYLKAMNCNPETVIHLSLLADYNATLYDPVSHNLNYGIEIVKQNNINPTLDFNSMFENCNTEKEYKPLPKFPATTRDLAVLCPKTVTMAQIVEIIEEKSKSLGPSKYRIYLMYFFNAAPPALDDNFFSSKSRTSSDELYMSRKS